MNRKCLALLFTVGAVFSGVGYAQEQGVSGAKESGGVPDPSVAYCLSVQGEVVALKDPEGSSENLCRLDFSMIDTWSLFYAKDFQRPPVALFLEHPDYVGTDTTNPLDQYCRQVGGQPVILTTESGQQFAVCRFRDGQISDIESATLFYGPSDPRNARLAALLNQLP